MNFVRSECCSCLRLGLREDQSMPIGVAAAGDMRWGSRACGWGAGRRVHGVSPVAGAWPLQGLTCSPQARQEPVGRAPGLSRGQARAALHYPDAKRKAA